MVHEGHKIHLAYGDIVRVEFTSQGTECVHTNKIFANLFLSSLTGDLDTELVHFRPRFIVFSIILVTHERQVWS